MDPITLAILGSSLVSAGASVGGAIYSNKKNSENVDKQNKFNLDMWKMANQYNTPVAQVNRLREAGINPALALGNISPGTAQGVTSAVHQPTINPLQELPNIVGNVISQSIQYDALKKQKQVSDSNIRLNNSKATEQDINNETLPEKNRVDIDSTKAGIKNVDANTALLQSQESLNQQAYENNKTALDLQNKLNEKQLEIFDRTVKKLDIEIDLSEYDLKYMKPAELANLRASSANLYATAQLAQQKVISEGVARELMHSQIGKIYEDIQAQAIANKWSKETLNSRIEQEKQRLINMFKEGKNVDANTRRTNVGTVLDIGRFGLEAVKTYFDGVNTSVNVVNVLNPLKK